MEIEEHWELERWKVAARAVPEAEGRLSFRSYVQCRRDKQSGGAVHQSASSRTTTEILKTDDSNCTNPRCGPTGLSAAASDGSVRRVIQAK